MIPNLPTLSVLPLDKLILHEDHDMQRTLPLVEKLRAQGILRNPPIVMPLLDGSGRYMVLDGANRFTSLKEMQFPHLVAQVVEASDTHVSLQTWNHVIWGLSAKRFIKELHALNDFKVRKVNIRKSFDPPDMVPALIRLLDGSVYMAYLPSSLGDKVKAMHRLVNCYKGEASFDRTSQTLAEGFKTIYPDFTALVIFPRFDIPSVLTLAGQGLVLPTGITRFTVSPRALHLNYPLHELTSNRPIEYKEAYLQRWIEERVKRKGVRYYAEATFLFDE